MKITNTFVRVADDCQVTMGTVPPVKDGERSLARLHYDLLSEHPYEYDLDTFNFTVFRLRNRLSDAEAEKARADFFAKPHPCMRTSPLTKSYGFGAHYNNAGKIAIYPVDSVAYRKMTNDPANRVEMAMRSKRPTNPQNASPQTAGLDPGVRQHSLHTAA